MLIANWVGGFSVAVTVVFVIIYLTGATLIRQGEGGPETDAQPEKDAQSDEDAQPEPEPYPEDDSNEAQPVTAESESTPG